MVVIPYRGHGYGRESLQLVIDYVFCVLGLPKISAIVENTNLASIRLFLSCNFQLDREDNGLKYFIKFAKK